MYHLKEREAKTDRKAGTVIRVEVVRPSLLPPPIKVG